MEAAVCDRRLSPIASLDDYRGHVHRWYENGRQINIDLNDTIQRLPCSDAGQIPLLTASQIAVRAHHICHIWTRVSPDMLRHKLFTRWNRSLLYMMHLSSLRAGELPSCRGAGLECCGTFLAEFLVKVALKIYPKRKRIAWILAIKYQIGPAHRPAMARHGLPTLVCSDWPSLKTGPSSRVLPFFAGEFEISVGWRCGVLSDFLAMIKRQFV